MLFVEILTALSVLSTVINGYTLYRTKRTLAIINLRSVRPRCSVCKRIVSRFDVIAEKVVCRTCRKVPCPTKMINPSLRRVNPSVG